MKKIYILLLSFLFMATCSIAQITIGQADMPQPGDTLRVSKTTNTTGLPPFANTGANYTWDYSMLTPMSQTIDTFLSVTSTPFAYQLYFNDAIFYPAYLSTVAQAAANLSNNPPVTITNVIYFYKDGASAYESVGFGSAINSIPTSTRDDSIDYMYRFPMNYNNADSCNSKYHVSIPSIAYYGARQHRVNHVDGWGTLKTPFGTFQTLRVTTELFVVDTLYIDTFHFGTAIPQPEQIQYKWFTNGQHIPLLQINENVVGNTPVLTGITYRDSARKIVNGIVQVNASSKGIQVFPNPAKNTVYLQSQSTVENLEIELYNITGETLMHKYVAKLEAGAPVPVDISGLSSGLYFIRTHNQNNVSTAKLIKE